MAKFDCIIPCFNEDHANLLLLIHTIRSIPETGRVICVDDGSVIGLPEMSGVTVIRHNRNLGKSDAFRTGLRHVRARTVCTIDADMTDVYAGEIRDAYNAYRKGGLDLLILRLIDEPKQARNFRGDILLSGERFIRTKLLADVLRSQHTKGFAVEMVTNAYVLERGLRYGWFPFSAHNIQPVEKLGLVRGIKKEIRQLRDIFWAVGPGGFWHLYRSFSPDLSTSNNPARG